MTCKNCFKHKQQVKNMGNKSNAENPKAQLRSLLTYKGLADHQRTADSQIFHPQTRSPAVPPKALGDIVAVLRRSPCCAKPLAMPNACARVKGKGAAAPCTCGYFSRTSKAFRAVLLQPSRTLWFCSSFRYQKVNTFRHVSGFKVRTEH